MGLRNVVRFAWLLACLGGCDSDDPDVFVPPPGMTPAPAPSVEGKLAGQWVGELGVPPEPVEQALVSEPCGAAAGCMVAPKPDGAKGEYGCGFVINRETKKAAQDLVVLGADEDLWPGNVLKANAARMGNLESVNVPRGPLSLSSTLQGGTASVVLADPKSSTVQEALNTLLAGHTMATGMAVGSSLVVDSVFSQEDLSKHFSVDLSLGGFLPIAAQLGLSSRRQTTTTHARVAVDFVQSFYRITIDTPPNAAAFFPAGLPADQLAGALNGDRPVYVRSVTYGRRVVAVFEDDKAQNATGLEGSIKASYLVSSGSTMFSMASMSTVQHTRFAAVVLGDARVFTSLEQLLAYLQEPPDVRTAWPIAYSLANVADGSAFSVGRTTEIVTRSCMTCGLNDPYADAVDVASAHALSMVPLSDSDSDSRTIMDGVLAPGERRWFSFDGRDDFPSVVDPEVTLNAMVSGARVCLYAQCNAGMTDPLCLVGQPATEGTLKGCCSDSGKAHLEGRGSSLCVGGGTDNARVYVSVEGPAAGGQCVGFGMTVHY